MDDETAPRVERIERASSAFVRDDFNVFGASNRLETNGASGGRGVMERMLKGFAQLSMIALAACGALTFVPDSAWDSFPEAFAPARAKLASVGIAPAKFRPVAQNSDGDAPADELESEPRRREAPRFEFAAKNDPAERPRVRVATPRGDSLRSALPEIADSREPVDAPLRSRFAGVATDEPPAPTTHEPVANPAPADDIFNDARFADAPTRVPAANSAPTDPPAINPPSSDFSAADAILDAPRSEQTTPLADQPPVDSGVGVAPMPTQIVVDGANAPSMTNDESAPPVEPVAAPALDAASTLSQTPAPAPLDANPAERAPLANATAAPQAETATPEVPAPVAQPENVVAVEPTHSADCAQPVASAQVSCSALLAQGDAAGSLEAAMRSASNVQSAEQAREVFVTLNQLRRIYLQNNQSGVVARINEALDRLAFEVFYNPRRAILEPLRQTKPGETLATIAGECQITPETLAAINGIEYPVDSPLPPGTTLKVVHGPVAAEVSVSRKELLLNFNNLYAGRFKCGVPRQASGLRGEFVVERKIENPECKAIDLSGAEVMIAGGAPENPLGACWIGLNGGYGLQGTNRPELVGADVPENGGFVFSNLHISQLDVLLPVGSSVIFTD